MNKVILVVSILFVIMALLVIGLTGYVFIEKQKLITATNMGSVAIQLKSKTISSIVAFGQVEAISGRTVTIKNESDTLSIKINDNAQIFLISSDGRTAPLQETASFSDIKIGQNLSISLKVVTTGELKGISAIIFPTVAK